MSRRPPSDPIVCLAAGHITVDRYGDARVPGGSAWYAARTWAALGVRPRIATAFGADLPDWGALRDLEASVVPAARSTRFVNEYPPGRPRVQWVEALAPAVRSESLPERWRRPDVLFLAPVINEIDAGAWVDRLRPRLCGLGLQGFVRGVGRRVPGTDRRPVRPFPWEPDPETLARVDVVFLSEEDLRLAGVALVERLRREVPLVVVTRGAAGCRLFARDRVVETGVFPTVEVDPTGAGDTFAAAFLLARSRGAAPAEAARFGAAAASIVVEGRGGACLGRVGEATARLRHVPLPGPAAPFEGFPPSAGVDSPSAAAG